MNATRDEVQMALGRLLLEKIRQDKYPSATHMSIVEHTLPPDLVRDYINVLLEKVLNDNHPSIPMLRRIARIAEALPSEAAIR